MAASQARQQRKSFALLRSKASWAARGDLHFHLLYVYPALAAAWAYFGSLPSTLATILLGAATVVAIFSHAVLILSIQWSLSLRSRLLFDSATDLASATHVLVTPHRAGRKAAICPIFKTVLADGSKQYCIDFLKRKYVARATSSDSEGFTSLHFPVDKPAKHYATCKGLSSVDARALLIQYGKNEFDIALPTFFELFKQHAVAPFFVFQIFCVLLWFLDEYWMNSCTTLFLLIGLECQLVHKRLREMSDLRTMRLKPLPLTVLRDGRWQTLKTDDLLPGDIFRMPARCPDGKTDFTSPCDALLLRGTAVVNESALTGESTPQTKVSLAVSADKEEQALDIKNSNKQNVIFAGTSITAEQIEFDSAAVGGRNCSPFPSLLFNSSPYNKNGSASKTQSQTTGMHVAGTEGGMVCYCLKTGFHTTQGKIVRTILYSSERVTGESKEAMAFLGVLLICALISSGYVLYHNLTQPGGQRRGYYKLILQCILIITSVVPPEFPITMSMAVTLSLIELVKERIFCTEPFRLPLAGRATICAFDKTGTITSGRVKVLGVLGLTDSDQVCAQLVSNRQPQFEEEEAARELPTPAEIARRKRAKAKKSIVEESECDQVAAKAVASSAPQLSESGQILPFKSAAVLASCHSLVPLDGHPVGDPLEQAALSAVGFKLSSAGLITSADGEDQFRIIKRYPFVSELQRMTVVVKHSGPARQVILHSGVQSDSSRDSFDTVFSSSGGNGQYVVCKGSPEMVATLLREIPECYKQNLRDVQLAGYRVISLAAKKLGAGSVDLADRNLLERNMEFCGFLVVGCPIKPHSIDTLRILHHSGHRLIMVTGDHVLTACQVAVDCELIPKTAKVPTSWILQSMSDKLIWRSRCGEFEVCNAATAEGMSKCFDPPGEHALCVTGPVLTANEDNETFWSIVAPRVSIWSRVSPPQKAQVIEHYTRLGESVVMCGDGTNDVNALVAANVGISLLSIPAPEKDKNTIPKKPTNRPETFKEMMERMKAEAEAMDGQVSLGCASIASPFTFKRSTINCVPTIIRLGRATLATVMAMYKTMAVNSLITAFTFSVLALDGVKLGDAQTTAESLLVSVLIFVTSRAQAAEHLTLDRPVERIFHPAILCSIFGQAAVHIACISTVWSLAKSTRPADWVPDIDGDFSSNIVNTVIFLVLAATHGATFLANHDGLPFLPPLSAHTALKNGLSIFFGAIALLTLEVYPEVNTFLALVPMPTWKFKLQMIVLLILDVLASWLLARACHVWSVRAGSSSHLARASKVQAS